MCGYTGTRLQFGRRNLSSLAFDPQRPDLGAGLIFESRRKIDEGAAGIAGVFPALARGLFIRSEEGEVNVLKLFGAHALDKADLISHRLKLSHGFVVIEQPNIGSGEVALVEHFGDFLAFERSGADNRSAVKRPARRERVRSRRGSDGLAHEVCET